MPIRPSPLAGRWYPADASALRREVDGYLAAAGPPPDRSTRPAVGVVAPHAGLRYSGPVAAHAFRELNGAHPDVVVVVGPMHHPTRHALLTTAFDSYRTPLGTVPVATTELTRVDADVRRRLGYGLAPVEHDPEHSIEIELPFLQRILPPFRLLPIMMADQDATTARGLGLAIAHSLPAESTLLVASSDLSHFYTQNTARLLDTRMLEAFHSFDPDRVLLTEEEGNGFACGRGAVAAVFHAARTWGAHRVRILRHATSGDVTGELDSVVGYGAAVIE